jgi:hypothetical protein
MRGHLADDMRIVTDAGRAGVGGPSVGLGGSAGREIVSDEGIQAAGRVRSAFPLPGGLCTRQVLLAMVQSNLTIK